MVNAEDIPEDFAVTVIGPDVAEDITIPGYRNTEGRWVEPDTTDMSAWRRVEVKARCPFGGVHGLVQHYQERLYPAAVDRLIADMRRDVGAAINACEGHRRGQEMPRRDGSEQ